jgi:nitroreductase
METQATLTNHRSVRAYQDKAVPPAVLDAVLEAAVRGSTTGNMQLYSIVQSTSTEMREKLHAIHMKQPMVLQAPVMLTFLADIRRFSEWCRARSADPGYDNFLFFQNAVIDAVIAAQNAAVAAEGQGLGICYVGTALYQAEALIELFALPKGVLPVTSIVLGYADGEPPQADRLPMDAVVHKEVYTTHSEEEICAFFKAKEAAPSSEQFVAENKLDNLAEVFTKVRYPKPTNLAVSRDLMKLLERQGFLNHGEVD